MLAAMENNIMKQVYPIDDTRQLNHITGIYLITHRWTHKKYVGSSVNVGRRINGHISESMRGGMCRIEIALRQLGLLNFTVELLEQCERSKLLERETYWIAKMDSYVNGFNTNEKAHATYGREFSEATRKRLSEARKRRITLPETREKMRIARLGKRHSNETRSKISRSSKGKIKTAEHRAALSVASLGKKKPKEQMDRLHECRRGMKHSSTTKLKMSLTKQLHKRQRDIGKHPVPCGITSDLLVIGLDLNNKKPASHYRSVVFEPEFSTNFAPNRALADEATLPAISKGNSYDKQDTGSCFSRATS